MGSVSHLYRGLPVHHQDTQTSCQVHFLCVHPLLFPLWPSERTSFFFVDAKHSTQLSKALRLFLMHAVSIGSRTVEACCSLSVSPSCHVLNNCRFTVYQWKQIEEEMIIEERERNKQLSKKKQSGLMLLDYLWSSLPFFFCLSGFLG